MQEDVPVNAVNPTAPRNPVLVPRTRPGPVTLAVFLLGVEVVLGLIAGGALLLAAGTVPGAFQDRATASLGSAADTVGGTDLDAISGAIRAVLVTAAVITLMLAVAAALLALPVARGNWSARVGVFSLAVAAVCAALGSSAYTAFGQRVDWAGAVGAHGERVAGEVGQAYGEAMPGWLVGAAGGLTDLQVLGYIAVAVLLALPVARPYFRRRPARVGPPAPAEEPTSAGDGADELEG